MRPEFSPYVSCFASSPSHRQQRDRQVVAHAVDRRATQEIRDAAVAVAAHDQHIEVSFGGEADELAADIAVAERAFDAADRVGEVAPKALDELLDVSFVAATFDVVGAGAVILSADALDDVH